MPSVREHRTWIALALTFFVALAGLMTAHTVRHIMLVRRSTEAVRPWMSVPYIAGTRHVPADVLFRAIGVQPHRFDRRPLYWIARQQHRPVADLIGKINTAIAQQRSIGNAPPTNPGRAP